MVKKVIAFHHESTNNLHWLPPYRKIGKNEYYIHFAPSVRMDGDTFNVNADMVIELPVEGVHQTTPLFKIALGQGYQAIWRWKKSTQMAMIRAALNSDNCDEEVKNLLVPRTLSQVSTAHSGQYLMTELSKLGAGFTQLNDDDLVVIKPELGAKGKGQALVPVRLLQHYIQAANVTPYKTLVEQYPMVEDTGPDAVEIDDETLLNPTCQWCITEYIPNIEEEMRILMAGDVIYLKCRKINKVGDNHYHQANFDGRVDIEPANYEQIGGTHELYPFIALITGATSQPYGSIDLFRTRKGQIGVFECCPQFGTWQVPPSVAHHLTDGLLTYLTS